MRHSAAVAYVVLATAWSLWILWLPAHMAAGPLTRGESVVAALTYRAAGLVCHQDDARSFHRGAWPLPVCARCTGLYAGGALGGIIAITVAWSRRRGLATSRDPLTVLRLGLVIAALPTAMLWGAEWLTGLPIGNGLRWLGALPLGAAVSAIVVWALLDSRATDNRARLE